MKYIIGMLLIFGITSGKTSIWGAGTEMGLHLCMHNAKLYATTTQLDTCPAPPPFDPTPEEESQGKFAHTHSSSPVIIIAPQSVQHDPDCIINKIPYTN